METLMWWPRRLPTALAHSACTQRLQMFCGYRWHTAVFTRVCFLYTGMHSAPWLTSTVTMMRDPSEVTGVLQKQEETHFTSCTWVRWVLAYRVTVSTRAQREKILLFSVYLKEEGKTDTFKKADVRGLNVRTEQRWSISRFDSSWKHWLTDDNTALYEVWDH